MGIKRIVMMGSINMEQKMGFQTQQTETVFQYRRRERIAR